MTNLAAFAWPFRRRKYVSIKLAVGMLLASAFTLVHLVPASANESPQETIRVAVTLPYLAEIAKAVGGDRVEVMTLVRPGVDPHHIQTTPALALQVAQADLLIENGMQLESWVPQLVAASENLELAQGASRHSFATNGLRALEIPDADEMAAGGHVHPAGNPHIWLDPLNFKGVAENIEQSLIGIAPSKASEWTKNRIEFQRQVDEAFFGSELVAIVGGRTLERLHRAGRLIPFLESKEFRNQKLIELLSGWLARAHRLPRNGIFTYHRTWSYFADTFGINVVATLEEKPGIPPGPAHLEKLSQLALEHNITLVVAPPYYPRTRIEGFAQRVGASLALLPTQPGEEGTKNLFEMVDLILERLETSS